MRILIVTGIYPPEIGGPAQYAKRLAEEWQSGGHTIKVRIFSKFNFLPTGVRHLAFFFSILPSVWWADNVLALDTFSAALPGVLAAKLFGKKIIVRTGGDFLWEAYVERTREPILLKDFYNTAFNKFSNKERNIFKIIRYVLNRVDAIVWSTEWQKAIFMEPYKLAEQKHFIVENYYPPVEQLEFDANVSGNEKIFWCPARNIVIKNIEFLKQIFATVATQHSGVILDLATVDHDKIAEKIRSVYAVIIPSLSEISPNLVIDALRYCVPVLVTEENGIKERIDGFVKYIPPNDLERASLAVASLLDQQNYSELRDKIRRRAFTHSWGEMAQEYLDIFKKI